MLIRSCYHSFILNDRICLLMSRRYSSNFMRAMQTLLEVGYPFSFTNCRSDVGHGLLNQSNLTQLFDNYRIYQTLDVDFDMVFLPCFFAVVTKPPYEITETGWGEFEIIIKIFFIDPNERPVSSVLAFIFNHQYTMTANAHHCSKLYFLTLPLPKTMWP